MPAINPELRVILYIVCFSHSYDHSLSSVWPNIFSFGSRCSIEFYNQRPLLCWRRSIEAAAEIWPKKSYLAIYECSLPGPCPRSRSRLSVAHSATPTRIVYQTKNSHKRKSGMRTALNIYQTTAIWRKISHSGSRDILTTERLSGIKVVQNALDRLVEENTNVVQDEMGEFFLTNENEVFSGTRKILLQRDHLRVHASKNLPTGLSHD